MTEVKEQDVLAKIRTLLALERNFLAEERTVLAEFRTGLALAFIGPTVSTILAYVLAVFTVDKTDVLDVINFAFFSGLTLFGVWIVFRSQSRLKTIRKKKRAIKQRIIELSKSSKDIDDLMVDYAKEG